jgi:hypothetical protein
MLVLLLLLITAQSTTVINPTMVEFTPSVDHNTSDVTGQPFLTRYELRIFLADGDTFVQPVNLNKPQPDANNLVRLNITDTILALPSGDYSSRVAAIGPGGENVSELSNGFVVDKGLPLSPTSLTIIK